MKSMFYNYQSLTKLNLSNFIFENIIRMYTMLSGYKYLIKNNVITNDKTILS